MRHVMHIGVKEKVMMGLSDGEEQTTFHLAASLSLKASSITAQLPVLEEKGYILLKKQIKEEGSDDYRYVFKITEEGKKIAEYIIEYCQWMIEHKYMFSDLTWNLAKVRRDHGKTLLGYRDVIKEGIPDV